MKKYNSSIELGTELVSLEQFDDRVEVKIHKRNTENSEVEEESSTYKWVVGTDGARGVVRKSLGLTFQGETKDEKFVIGDIILKGLCDVDFPLFSLSSTIYSKTFRDGICGETWELLGECFVRLVIEYTEGVFPERTSIRITEIPGLFNFIVGGSHLENIDEITASQDAVRAFLRERTSNRSDITFGEVICYSPYKYVNYASGISLKLKDA
jgi:hypothetical protein